MMMPEDHEEETPWMSFADAVTALLFIFIATTFFFMLRQQQAEAALLAATEENREENAKLRGADEAAGRTLTGVQSCLLARQGPGVRVWPVVEESSRTMSMLLEPGASTIVEWFQECSAAITPEAAEVVSLARDCLVEEVPRLAENYTVVLTLEGHTDARAPGASCRDKFPSNWELSGARAGAALRRLTCEDDGCTPEAASQAARLSELAQDRDRLQLVAAGRADSIPAWRALCDTERRIGTERSPLDQEVCGHLADSTASARHRLESAARVIRASLSPDLLRKASAADDVLVAWANDPRCAGRMTDPVCAERFRRMRRVDMRIDPRPRRDEGTGARAQSSSNLP